MSLTIKEAAAILGVHRTYINRLIILGILKAERRGWGWLIEEKDLKKIKRNPLPWFKPRKKIKA